jgi:hypothetical protein
MPKQEISPYDLIVVSDTGKFFVVKMKETQGGHEPATVEPLDPTFQKVPDYLRSQGVELADIREHVNVGGASCYLLNLQRIEEKP